MRLSQHRETLRAAILRLLLTEGWLTWPTTQVLLDNVEQGCDAISSDHSESTVQGVSDSNLNKPQWSEQSPLKLRGFYILTTLEFVQPSAGGTFSLHRYSSWRACSAPHIEFFHPKLITKVKAWKTCDKRCLACHESPNDRNHIARSVADKQGWVATSPWSHTYHYQKWTDQEISDTFMCQGRLSIISLETFKYSKSFFILRQPL